MSAGSHNCHIRQSTFRRLYCSAPANFVLVPIVDPACGIFQDNTSLGGQGAAGRVSDIMGAGRNQ
jgi:hypothetical protein